jgi:hypothetical protein
MGGRLDRSRDGDFGNNIRKDLPFFIIFNGHGTSYVW